MVPGTGHLLPLDAPGEDHAQLIASLLRDRGALQRMGLAARERYETELDWATWGRKFGSGWRKSVDVDFPNVDLSDWSRAIGPFDTCATQNAWPSRNGPGILLSASSQCGAAASTCLRIPNPSGSAGGPAV